MPIPHWWTFSHPDVDGQLVLPFRATNGGHEGLRALFGPMPTFQIAHVMHIGDCLWLAIRFVVRFASILLHTGIFPFSQHWMQDVSWFRRHGDLNANVRSPCDNMHRIHSLDDRLHGT